MRLSEMLVPTLRETPAEAEIISHKLLLRAGFIRRTAAGIYTYLPLGMRVIKKIMNIIREEMDAKGGQELLMPIMQPAELWLESGRWQVYGPELMRFKDRHQRDFCLGPTHEEVITTLMRTEIKSYKQLPQLLYQIANKYRDEQRPRFGLMRGREFIMKDLYSFDRDQAALDLSYKKMYDAYTNIFSRCGLTFRPVEADSGAIGGSDTHEFMVLAESGEATVLYCDSCSYAANAERTPASAPAEKGGDALALEAKSTPGAHTVEEVTNFLNISPQQIIKTLIYQTDQGVVAALIRGDRELNEIKLYNLLGCLTLELANASTVTKVTGAPVGFAGPVGLKDVKIIADPEVANLINGVAGANEAETHLINVNPQRDFTIDQVHDIRMVEAGEDCPLCSGKLISARGIEVGQVFKLGDTYSKVLKAHYLDDSGKEQPVMMGCYGIGVGRTMAAAVEQNNDENGITWPVQIAPYHVVVVPVNNRNTEMMALAEKIYQELMAAGLEVVLDDRPERPGVKFKDADLIGYPVRIVVGKKAVAEDEIEVHHRSKQETNRVSYDKLIDHVEQILFAP